MAKSKALPKAVMTRFLEFLSTGVHLLCDDTTQKSMTPKERAAMHLFFHEWMGAYHRALSGVPVTTFSRVLENRFQKFLAKEKLEIIKAD